MQVRIKKVTDTAVIPTSGSKYSAGLDLCADMEQSVIIHSHEAKVFHTGLVFEIPKGYYGAIYARSGLATRHGLRPTTCVSVIDCDYRGEVLVGIYNDSDEDQFIIPRERIAQMVIQPYLPVELVEADELTETDRGENGFGSTGRR